MNYSYQKGFSWPLVFFVLVLGLVLLGLSFTSSFSRRSPNSRVYAMSNAKAIVGGLNYFRQEYGTYPCDASRVFLVEKGVDNLPSGKSANAYFAQLIANGALDSEHYFHAPGVKGTSRGDDIKRPSQLLAQGENGFAYIMASDGRPLSGHSANMPLVIAPVSRGDSTPLFDAEVYDGKYIYGTIDGSAKQGDIDEDGTAMSSGRAHLFEGGRDSLFGGETPVIAYPLGF